VSSSSSSIEVLSYDLRRKTSVPGGEPSVRPPPLVIGNEEVLEVGGVVEANESIGQDPSSDFCSTAIPRKSSTMPISPRVLESLVDEDCSGISRASSRLGMNFPILEGVISIEMGSVFLIGNL